MTFGFFDRFSKSSIYTHFSSHEVKIVEHMDDRIRSKRIKEAEKQLLQWRLHLPQRPPHMSIRIPLPCSTFCSSQERQSVWDWVDDSDSCGNGMWSDPSRIAVHR